ncbi:MAG TPA: hypothetical protein VMD07_04040, partial [Candidatus Acidoferrales bacterium]|nr:hypothetical protein [Candidatus Acidoferrales bacterium]
MKSTVLGGADFLRRIRGGIDVMSIRAEAKRPFRIFLCGDLALVGELRALLLSGHDGTTPADAAATLETVFSGEPPVSSEDVKAVVFLGRPGDHEGVDLAAMLALKVPVFQLTVHPELAPSHPISAPESGKIGDYAVSGVSVSELRSAFFPHLVQACSGVEVAVAR